ncbi:hypothetical protein SISNIDRAFT_481144 [Sistotremastrum niveocremeum HHB9708]|uniref:Uncharacterized protein n=1 Tax=Sistotremastrum niveocremeum HHB9708 TaxID=1314777 RepID=A0A165A2L6_9AGAM|nr:hypothetical protein SISNIDRAFT_481144 [Sistotremastrum niveocremeum HHB9708]
MSLKRKCDDVAEDEGYTYSKQMRLCPGESIVMDTDVAMSDICPSDASPTLTNTTPPSPYYPTLEIYPQTPFSYFTYSSQSSSPKTSPECKPVGLMQPKSFTHKGNCDQIPKLRVACEAGPGGQRTMWSFCEQCGAVEMVD